MISATLDKKDYFEAMESETQSDASYSNSALSKRDANFDFKSLLVKSQWIYAKKQLDENENPRTLLERGDLYLLRGNYKKAVQYYQRSLILDADYIPAYEKIIFAYTSHRVHSEARVYFKELLKKTNNRAEIFRKYILFDVDALFLGDGNFADTLELITEGLAINQNDFELINTYGFIVLNYLNKLDEAEKHFDRALAIDPNFFHAVNNKGVCQLRTERFTEAKNSFLKCIEVSPRNYPFGYQNLIFLYVNDDKFQEAYEIFELARKNKVILGNDWQHMFGWLLIQIGKFQEAVLFYESKIKDEPKNQLLLNNLGFCYVSLGLTAQAELKFKSAIKITEDSLNKKQLVDKRALKAYYNLGRSAYSRKDVSEVERIANRILSLNKDDAFAYYLKGSACIIDDNFEQAKRFFEMSLNLDANIQDVYPNYSFILSSIDKNYTEAIKILNKAIDLGFRSLLIINNLVYSYIKNGSLDIAEEILTKVKSEMELPTILLATSGLLEMRKGNIKKANELYAQSIEKHNDVKNKSLIEQIQMLENARVYLEQKNFDKSREYIMLAKKFPSSYVDSEIEEIDSALSKVS